MAKYQVETENGTFEVETEDGINFGDVANAAKSALFKPSATSIAQGGLDPAQRMGQAALGSIYEQGKNLIQDATPESLKENLGKGVSGAILPPIISQRVPSFLNKKIGRAGVGGVVDVASGLGTELSEPLASGASKAIKAIGESAEGTGGRFMNFYIKPRAAGYRFGANPGRAIAKHIGPQMSRDSLLEAVISKKQELMNQLTKAVSKNNGNPVEATPIFKHIGDTLKQLQTLPNVYKDQIESHRALFDDLANMIRKNALVKDGKIYLKPSDAVAMKRAIGEIPSWNVLDPKLGSLSKTSRKIYGSFDKEIDKSVPESAGLNRDVSDLIGAQKGIELGAQREQNKDPLRSLSDMMSLGLGSSVGGVPGAAIGYGTSRLLKSAPFNTSVGAVSGGIGKGARVASRVLDQVEGPEILKQIHQMFNPETGLSVVNRPTFAESEIPSLSRNRASEVSRQLPDAISTGRPPIKASGPSPTIELPEFLDSDLERMGKQFNAPEFSSKKEVVIPQGRLDNRPTVSSFVKNILARRKKNFQ